MAKCSRCQTEVGCGCNLQSAKNGEKICAKCKQKEIDSTPGDQILTPEQQARLNAR